ncbi:MAG: suppressor of fused domain protein, partial [Campylobacter sp.]|nr:suppressor of fused domain protein [Campylobacter sp.]
MPYALGGKDPLNGVSVFDCDERTFHRHIVSYGMSELFYDPESAGNEFSGWGFEFSMRVAPYALDQDAGKAKNEPYWAMNLMQNLAGYVFESKKWFEAYHFIPANGPLRLDTDTKLTAVIFVPDPKLSEIETPNGKVAFLQMFGIMDSEYEWLLKDPTTDRVKEMASMIDKDNPLFIT